MSRSTTRRRRGPRRSSRPRAGSHRLSSRPAGRDPADEVLPRATGTLRARRTSRSPRCSTPTVSAPSSCGTPSSSTPDPSARCADAELVSLASEVWLMNDNFVRLMEEGYRAQQSTMLVTAQQERFALVYTILTGMPEDGGTLWEAVDRLPLPRTGGFVVVAVRAATAGSMPLPLLEGRARPEAHPLRLGAAVAGAGRHRQPRGHGRGGRAHARDGGQRRDRGDQPAVRELRARRRGAEAREHRARRRPRGAR
ncbi:MAG: hypothetical protein WDM88_12920 [Galbitalea sp.]